MEKVLIKPPFGAGEPEEVDAAPEKLIPRMVAGWTQCEAPDTTTEVIENVHD
ncbi:MAG: hypothetical protein KJZ78_21035 [Bryobacteraceae bacterium]|nr:hypothetical protein [Bryobacteraceae bacterium]